MIERRVRQGFALEGDIPTETREMSRSQSRGIRERDFPAEKKYYVQRF